MGEGVVSVKGEGGSGRGKEEWGRGKPYQVILIQLCTHRVETSYVISPYSPHGSVCSMFDPRIISVGSSYRLTT